MERLTHKVQNLARRKYRVRARITGTSTRPRLTVFISNLHITAQIIDDERHATLAYATTVGNKSVGGTMTERAEVVGNEIAKKAKSAKISRVVFDRNGRLYHGRIKALADAARAGGLDF
ncbi:MAG TPA: 50S ribosomal protein L18 [Candidatus Limnocylindrales bacterium]|nr:50S ribosomal protein L18 [Candidatus Limnocylindrales bacterium]